MLELSHNKIVKIIIYEPLVENRLSSIDLRYLFSEEIVNNFEIILEKPEINFLEWLLTNNLKIYGCVDDLKIIYKDIVFNSTKDDEIQINNSLINNLNEIVLSNKTTTPYNFYEKDITNITNFNQLIHVYRINDNNFRKTQKANILGLLFNYSEKKKIKKVNSDEIVKNLYKKSIYFIGNYENFIELYKNEILSFFINDKVFKKYNFPTVDSYLYESKFFPYLPLPIITKIENLFSIDFNQKFTTTIFISEIQKQPYGPKEEEDFTCCHIIEYNEILKNKELLPNFFNTYTKKGINSQTLCKICNEEIYCSETFGDWGEESNEFEISNLKILNKDEYSPLNDIIRSLYNIIIDFSKMFNIVRYENSSSINLIIMKTIELCNYMHDNIVRTSRGRIDIDKSRSILTSKYKINMNCSSFIIFDIFSNPKIFDKNSDDKYKVNKVNVLICLVIFVIFSELTQYEVDKILFASIEKKRGRKLFLKKDFDKFKEFIINSKIWSASGIIEVLSLDMFSFILLYISQTFIFKKTTFFIENTEVKEILYPIFFISTFLEIFNYLMDPISISTKIQNSIIFNQIHKKMISQIYTLFQKKYIIQDSKILDNESIEFIPTVKEYFKYSNSNYISKYNFHHFKEKKISSDDIIIKQKPLKEIPLINLNIKDDSKILYSFIKKKKEYTFENVQITDTSYCITVDKNIEYVFDLKTRRSIKNLKLNIKYPFHIIMKEFGKRHILLDKCELTRIINIRNACIEINNIILNKNISWVIPFKEKHNIYKSFEINSILPSFNKDLNSNLNYLYNLYLIFPNKKFLEDIISYLFYNIIDQYAIDSITYYFDEKENKLINDVDSEKSEEENNDTFDLEENDDGEIIKFTKND